MSAPPSLGYDCAVAQAVISRLLEINPVLCMNKFNLLPHHTFHHQFKHDNLSNIVKVMMVKC